MCPAQPRHRSRRVSLTLAATCVLALTLATGGPLLAPHAHRALAATAYYQITDLQTLGGSYSFPGGINNAGLPVGFAANTIADPIYGDQSRAVTWTGSTPTDLGTIVPGGIFAFAQNVNDAGEIVGASSTSTITDPVFNYPDYHATLWYHGTIHDLGTLGGGESNAWDIAQNGTAVGDSYLTGDAAYHATLWANGHIRDLGTLPEGNNSFAYGIDAAGTVVAGESDITTTVDPLFGVPDEHAVLWQGSMMHDLGTLGGTLSAAFTTNGSSVIGISYLSGNATFHPALWASGHIADLGVLPGDVDGGAYDINRRGQIVGFSSSATQVASAVLWQGSTPLDLNRLIPAGSGWQLQ